MELTFVQSDEEYSEAMKVLSDGAAGRMARLGTWIIPPCLSKEQDGTEKFTVVDHQLSDERPREESFSTLDGAMMFALGIYGKEEADESDYRGSLKDRGQFV